MEPDAVKPAHPQRLQPPFVLQPSELPLDRAAPAIEISGCRRSALIHVEAGAHSPVGQRHLLAPRLRSDPAKVQTP